MSALCEFRIQGSDSFTGEAIQSESRVTAQYGRALSCLMVSFHVKAADSENESAQSESTHQPVQDQIHE